MAQQVVSPTAPETATGSTSGEASSVRLLTHRQLVLLRFRKNRLAVLGLVILVALYVVTIFCEFLAPYDPNHRFQGYVHIPPSKIHIRTADGQWRAPFIYKVTRKTDPGTFERTYAEDTSTPYPIQFFYNAYPKYLFEFVVLKDSPIKSLADLKGKKLGVGALTFGNIPLSRAMLQQSGVTWMKDVEVLPVGVGPAAWKRLTDKEIDVLNLFAHQHEVMEVTGIPIRTESKGARMLVKT